MIRYSFALLLGCISMLISTNGFSQDCEYYVNEREKNKLITKQLIVNTERQPLIFSLCNLASFKTININLFVNHDIGCFQFASELTLMFENGTQLKLKNAGEEDCGDHMLDSTYQYATVFLLNESTIKDIIQHKLKKISLKSTKEEVHFTIKQEYQDYFIRNIHCIELESKEKEEEKVEVAEDPEEVKTEESK